MIYSGLNLKLLCPKEFTFQTNVQQDINIFYKFSFTFAFPLFFELLWVFDALLIDQFALLPSCSRIGPDIAGNLHF